MNDRNSINVAPAYFNIFCGAVVLFYALIFMFFWLVLLCYFGNSDNMQAILHQFMVSMIFSPWTFFQSFRTCLSLLADLSALQIFCFAVLFIAFFALFVWIVIFGAKQTILYSYRKAFATEKEIENARLFSGDFHFLGTAFRKPLRTPFNNSVLSFTTKNSLNPVTVATPSVFNDNECNMVIIDCSGNFQKITAGYRSLLGKTLCFDWENKNNRSANKFLPCWNPLSAKMLPDDEDKKQKYIATLANGILSVKKPAEEMSSLYLQCLILFFMAKVQKATANDYFLNTLLRKGRFEEDDKAMLMSYYLLMPDEVTEAAKNLLTADNLSADQYIPIGSWENIMEEWQGKDLNLAMIYDSLLQGIAKAKASENAEKQGVWNILLEEYKQEAEFFNYPENVCNILTSLLEKTADEKFDEIIEALSLFKNQLIREKTLYSDFTYDEIRGFSTDDVIYPMTIYLSARTEDEKSISKIMLHMLINETLQNYKNQNPVVFVIDDTEGLGYIQSLSYGIGLGERANVSFLVFNNNIEQFKETYGEKNYRDILNNVGYFVVSADTADKHKKLLSAIANSKIQEYMGDSFLAVEKLAVEGDDNAIVINNDYDPLFIQTRLLSQDETYKYFEDSIINASPYIDEYIKAGRPAFFETMSVPKPFKEKTEKNKKRKKEAKKEPESSVDEWWLDDASFAFKENVKPEEE